MNANNFSTLQQKLYIKLAEHKKQWREDKNGERGIDAWIGRFRGNEVNLWRALIFK